VTRPLFAFHCKLSIPPSPTWTRTVDAIPTENVGEVSRDATDAAESSAAGDVEVSEIPFQNGGDPALRLLLEAWDGLSDSVKNQILRLADDAVAEGR